MVFFRITFKVENFIFINQMATKALVFSLNKKMKKKKWKKNEKMKKMKKMKKWTLWLTELLDGPLRRELNRKAFLEREAFACRPPMEQYKAKRLGWNCGKPIGQNVHSEKNREQKFALSDSPWERPCCNSGAWLCTRTIVFKGLNFFWHFLPYGSSTQKKPYLDARSE